jgi:Protein of unknown function (DUF1553)/Protein of unknown function (DUF1549)/Planctomycete cytochrome C
MLSVAWGSGVWLTFAVCVILALASASSAGESGRVSYSRDIRPILSNTCYKCHGPDEKERKAGLRLDIKQGALAKLESGQRAIVPRSSAQSEVYRRLSSSDPDFKMPPPDSGKTISPEQIQLIKRWIDEGAEFHPHWAFVAPKRPAVPRIKTPIDARNPIDRFVIERLQNEGLRPSPPADQATLIRRVTFDLTGLPPTIRELEDFLADDSPNAYGKLVDRLLDSPQYGEQMTRYWLDAARYGDTHGLHLDNERSIWPYRDWLIRSFNADEPYDRFVLEQLAGDLLPHPTLDQRIATGFCRCNVTTGEGGAIEEEFAVRYAVERVETTGTVFLGMTFGCCVCHDHKFDPITQREFYSLYGYFNSLTERGLDGNALLPPPMISAATPEQLREIEARKKERASVEATIRSTVRKFPYREPIADASFVRAGPGAAKESPAVDRKSTSLSAWEASAPGEQFSFPVLVARALKTPADQRTTRQKNLLRDYFIENVYTGSRSIIDPLHAQLAEAQRRVDESQAEAPSTMVMQDAPERRDAFVLIRGAYDHKDAKVAPTVPAAIGPPLPKDAPPDRLSLARWIIDPRNPLTARVIVNRIWQHDFGAGIVKTAEDFGSQGEWPSHPELLDWLATELVRSGWDLKHIQRLILTSATYRQSSHMTEEQTKRDPENRLLARGPRYRMDAEMIRDEALAVSGLLWPKIGGKSVKPYQPSGLWEAIGYSGSNTVHFVQDTGEALYRRSMYTFWKRTSPPPSLITFDAPSREECVVRRGRTDTPLQALVLMNDEQYVEAARHFAERMLREGGLSFSDRVAYGFLLATSRRLSPDEVRVFEKLYAAQRAVYDRRPDQAMKLLHVGDSAYDAKLDARELAAWTELASVILNLDETVTKG